MHLQCSEDSRGAGRHRVALRVGGQLAGSRQQAAGSWRRMQGCCERAQEGPRCFMPPLSAGATGGPSGPARRLDPNMAPPSHRPLRAGIVGQVVGTVGVRAAGGEGRAGWGVAFRGARLEAAPGGALQRPSPLPRQLPQQRPGIGHPPLPTYVRVAWAAAPCAVERWEVVRCRWWRGGLSSSLSRSRSGLCSAPRASPSPASCAPCCVPFAAGAPPGLGAPRMATAAPLELLKRRGQKGEA